MEAEAEHMHQITAPTACGRVGGRTAEVRTAAALRQQFGLRSVRFAPRYSRARAAEQLQRIAHALMDLADVLQWEDRDLSGGVLSLRLGMSWIGSYGGKAYYRTFTIALRESSASLAHEYGHFLDAYLGTLAADGAIGDTRTLLTSLVQPGRNLRADLTMPAIARAFQPVMEAIYCPVPAYTVRAQPVSDPGWRFARELGRRHCWNVDAALREVAARQPQQSASYLEQLGHVLASLAARRGVPVPCFAVPETRSHFYRSALAQPNAAYWSRPSELFARAFAAFVEDRLTEQGRQSPHLVKGTLPGLAAASGAGYNLPPRHPEGEERRRINRAIGDFLLVIKAAGLMRYRR